MKDYIKSMESVKRRLAKAEMPERWNEESFKYAQTLAQIIIARLEKIVGSKIQVKSIEPKILKIAPRLIEASYILGLERCIYDVPKDAQVWNEEEQKKIKSLSKSIARRLQIFFDKGNEETESRTLTFNRPMAREEVG